MVCGFPSRWHPANSAEEDATPTLKKFVMHTFWHSRMSFEFARFAFVRFLVRFSLWRAQVSWLGRIFKYRVRCLFLHVWVHGMETAVNSDSQCSN